eukprot:1047346-Pyramimonas_sp.AAC.1
MRGDIQTGMRPPTHKQEVELTERQRTRKHEKWRNNNTPVEEATHNGSHRHAPYRQECETLKGSNLNEAPPTQT